MTGILKNPEESEENEDEYYDQKWKSCWWKMEI
jgi:hypothetical protein